MLYKKYFSADYAQSKAERIFNQFCVSIDIRRHADGAVVGILAIVDLFDIAAVEVQVHHHGSLCAEGVVVGNGFGDHAVGHDGLVDKFFVGDIHEHHHRCIDAMVFFPLLLIGVEELVQNRRRGVFALAVAVNCIVNYWFFIGEVVFVVLYVFLRMTDRSWGMTVKRFCPVALESVLGLCLAMVVLLPSVLAIMGNPRTTSDNLLYGWTFWIYSPVHVSRHIF